MGRGTRRDRRWTAGALGVLAALCVLPLAACGDDESRDSSQSDRPLADASDPRDVTVEMRADGYHPRKVRVRPGGRVTWVNTGTRRATAETLGTGARHFDTHTIYRGQSKSWVFEHPGRYEYHSSYDSSTFDGVLIVGPDSAGKPAR